MDLLLKNETTGEVREVKNGSAYYMICNIFGIFGIIALIISIIKKQFKAYLSFVVIELITTAILFLIIILMGIFQNTSLEFVFGLIYYLYLLASLVFLIYIVISLIMNLNYWSYNQYIKEGYVLQNESDLGVLDFVTKAQTKQRPFWLFFL